MNCLEMKYIKFKPIFFLVVLSLVPALAGADEIDEVIKKMVENLNGETAMMQISMTVKTSRIERTMKMKSYSIGQEKSFIKILYPRKDAGITFLKIDGSMWQYVPRIEKIIKIPSSMMMQSWMGSDFSNDDLVKESSLSDDYTHTLISETDTEYHVKLHPKAEAAVVWGGIEMSVSKQYYLPMKVSYFDEDGLLVRDLVYSDVKSFDGHSYPSRWIMTPQTADKKGHETLITVSDVVFNSEIDEGYFSKRALKRFSK